MACVIEHCETEPYSDYPACSVHARDVRNAHRACRCEPCQVERIDNDRRALSSDQIAAYSESNIRTVARLIVALEELEDAAIAARVFGQPQCRD